MFDVAKLVKKNDTAKYSRHFFVTMRNAEGGLCQKNMPGINTSDGDKIEEGWGRLRGWTGLRGGLHGAKSVVARSKVGRCSEQQRLLHVPARPARWGKKTFRTGQKGLQDGADGESVLKGY